MTLHDIGWLVAGLVLGWVTKIPIFLRHYREWERERDSIRKWMKKRDDEGTR